MTHSVSLLEEKRLPLAAGRTTLPGSSRLGGSGRRAWLGLACGVAWASAVASGCGSDPKPEPVVPQRPVEPPPAPPPPQLETQVQKLGDDPQQATINLSDEIQSACGISDAEAHFAFDSARVQRGDQPVLGKLVQCFSVGQLGGRTLRLVGHSDPRGESEYNMVLGGQRAENVRAYLVGEGLRAGQVESTSRGELDAQGYDEASWDQDRRVDIVLVD